MLERLRYALAALLLCAAVFVVFDGAFAQDVESKFPVERESPRNTVFGFFGAVKDVVKERVPDVEAARERALEFMDLGGLEAVEDPARRTERDWAVALQLKSALDFYGELSPEDVPDAAQVRGSSFWSLTTAEGDITLTLSPSEGWRFSQETLLRVPGMVARFEASGAERIEAESMKDRVLKRFPALTGRALFLPHWQWLGLALLFLLCWLVHRIVAYIVTSVIAGVLSRRRWAKAAADAARNAGRPAGYFGVALLIVFLGPLLELPVSPTDLNKWVVTIGSKLFASVGAVLILYRLSDVVAARLAAAAEETESRLDDQLVPIVRKGMKIIVTVVGVLFILDNLEADIWSLLAGAGFAGIAFAFAAQDTVRNLFGSLTVFTDRPFQVGDWIVAAGVEGTVEEVGFRSTRVRTFYNSLVSVPNAKFVDGIVDNMGMRRYRRFKTTVGVRYDTPPERIEAFCHGMRKIVRANENMRQDYFEIYLNDWGASSLNILVYVFFEVPDWDAELRERQNFMLEVIRLARALGVGFAFPTTTLEIERTPEHQIPAPQTQTLEQLSTVANEFAKGGRQSRPDGTLRFSSRERGEHEEEARGGE